MKLVDIVLATIKAWVDARKGGELAEGESPERCRELALEMVDFLKQNGIYGELLSKLEDLTWKYYEIILKETDSVIKDQYAKINKLTNYLED